MSYGHICNAKQAVRGDGWVAECSCGFSVGNLADVARANEEADAHLERVRAPLPEEPPFIESTQRCRACGARLWWTATNRRWWTSAAYPEDGYCLDEPPTPGVAIPDTCPAHRDGPRAIGDAASSLSDDERRQLQRQLEQRIRDTAAAGLHERDAGDDDQAAEE